MRDGARAICAQRRGSGARRPQHHRALRPRASAPTIAIPALLAVAAVHHHLIRGGLRTEVGLVVETGEARQVHDFCLLAGYGAEAINPYLAFDTLPPCSASSTSDLHRGEAHERYIKAIAKGILKVMSKMGICTFQSYCGAQIFDAIGLKQRIPRQVFHRHGRRRSKASASTRSPRRRCAAIASPSATRPTIATRSMSAASSRSASTAKRHAWTPTPCRCCSTRCAATTIASSRNTRASSATRRKR